MQRILVPLDGSRMAETAIVYASALARHLQGELLLLSVWETFPEEVESVGPDHVMSLRDQGMRYFRSYLQNVAEVLRREGLSVDVEVRCGHPAYEIILAAAEREADLVAMASHGRRGVTQRRRGSVADKVLRGSTVPLLIVGPRGLEAWPHVQVSIRTILVPLDGSAESEAAMPVAVEVARAASSRIRLLRVVPPMLGHLAIGLPESYPPDVDARLTRAAKTSLQKVKRLYGDVVDKVVVERGIPAQAIARSIEWNRPDLVVMASRSRFAGGRWALGSVADDVMEGPVPVIVVHPGATV